MRQGNGWPWLTQAGQRRFGVVRSLLRVLEDGQAAKDVVDVAIDANSAMQNLREAIAGAQPPPPLDRGEWNPFLWCPLDLGTQDCLPLTGLPGRADPFPLVSFGLKIGTRDMTGQD